MSRILSLLAVALAVCDAFMISSSSVLAAFDIDKMTIEALLFQTGYMTIKHTQRAGGQTFYTLGYPIRRCIKA